MGRGKTLGDKGMSSIRSTKDLGQLVKSLRKASGMTQVEAAGACGVGVRFLSELENGKPSVQLDSVLAVLSGLGLELRASKIADDVVDLGRNAATEQSALHQALTQNGNVSLAVQINQPEMLECMQRLHQAKKLLQHAHKPVSAPSRSVQPSSPSIPEYKPQPAKRSLTGL